jgi:hypothetical protein
MQNKINSENKKIVDQVDKWELYARLSPTIFLVVSIILVVNEYIDFETTFFVGLGLFAITAVTWWFWTIYTIRHLVITLQRASESLIDVQNEFKIVRKGMQEMKNEEK